MGFYGLAAALFAISVIASGAIGYSKGSASRNDEVSALSAAIKASEILAAEADERAKAVSERVVIQYREKVRIVREQSPAEVQLIERVVREADPNCSLPPSLRVLWDSPAAPGGQTPEGPPGVDGPPVTVAQLANGIDEAKRRFAENAARLEALQDIINSQ